MAPKERKTVYFITVDEYEDHPESGQLMLKKPTTRIQFPYLNDAEHRDRDGIHHPAQARSLSPDKWHGMYTIPGDSEGYDKMVAVMDRATKAYPKKIIGPFARAEEAIQAKHFVRTQTPKEKVGTLTAKVEDQNKELAELKATLAAFNDKRNNG